MSRIFSAVCLPLVLCCCLSTRAQLTTNLPIMVIDTHFVEILDEPKIPADMKIIYNGPGKLNHDTDVTYDFNGVIGIELRGSSSQSFPKKPYAIEIQDGSGNSIDASLLGMPKKDDWVLDASFDDKTLMRNEIAYKLGRSMGRYASRTRFVEVLLNGIYLGVYALQEKVKRDKNRVNIAKLDPASTTGDDVTGGYIIKIDKTTGAISDGWYSGFPPEGGRAFTYFQYDYPKPEDIVPAQKTYIQSYVSAFEKSLSSATYADPVNGYAKYIDVSSAVDFFLMMEATKNPDGYRLSTFLSKQKDSEGGKLSLGPIWDFNEGFGNVNYCTQGNPEGFVWSFNSICPDDDYQVPFWWDRFFSDPAFKNAVAARWTALRAGPFKTPAVLEYADSVASVMTGGPMQRNFQTWPIIGQYEWPNYYVETSYQDGVNWMKEWITERMDWLDNNLAAIVSGTDDRPLSFALNAFPNPFFQDVTVEVQLVDKGNVSLELCDLMGRKLETHDQYYNVPGKYQTVFHLMPGIYIFKAKADGEVKTVKVAGRL